MIDASLPINSKLVNTGTSIFTRMSALAAKHSAINLSQGFPNFSSSPLLMDLVHKYMRQGYNQYAPMAGVLPLRERIAEKMHKLYGKNICPNNEITITSGATQAIYTTITSLVCANDEVIVLEPAFDCYVPAIALCGAKPVYISLKAPHYTIDWTAVQAAISPRTKMIIINNPHNPTGTVLRSEDVQALIKLVAHTNIFVLSDEVYEHLSFDGIAHESLLRYPALWNRLIATYSFGKSLHATGWKIGYCIAPTYIMQEFRKVHQFVVFSVSTPVQYAIAEYLANPDTYLSLAAFFQQKRDYFLSLLRGSRFSYIPSQGSYYQMLNYSAISTEKDTHFAARLTKEYGVAAIPPSVFYHNNYDAQMLRFCFAKTDETLEKAAARLRKV